MPRRKKQSIKTNDVNSLTSLLQEVYNDACSNINDAQKVINEMSNAAEPEDVDDLTKIAKEKTNALKVKDSAIKLKLEVGKIQNDIIKNSGNEAEAIKERSEGAVTVDDFQAVRDMIKKANEKSD